MTSYYFLYYLQCPMPRSSLGRSALRDRRDYGEVTADDGSWAGEEAGLHSSRRCNRLPGQWSRRWPEESGNRFRQYVPCPCPLVLWECKQIDKLDTL